MKHTVWQIRANIVRKLDRAVKEPEAVASRSSDVAELERRFSVIEELETQVEANLKRAERLRQAILSRAFEGKLLPQDPADEPAAVLLERIRAMRGCSGTATPGCAPFRDRRKGSQAKVPVPQKP